MRIFDLSHLPDGPVRIDTDTLLVDFGAPAERVIEVSDGARLVLCGALQGTESDTVIRRDIRLCGADTRAIVWYAVAGSVGAARLRLAISLSANDASADVRTLCLARDAGLVDLDAGIAIETGVARAKWHLAEDHIFVGAGGKIRGIPRLDVRSSDVEASHALRVERISDERLFLLRGRGMDEADARETILRGLVRAVYSHACLPDETLATLEETVFDSIFSPKPNS